MIARSICLSFVLFLTSCASSGLELKGVGRAELVALLNYLEILAEMHELPYSVRVIRVGEPGECNGSPESCPKVRLYIAVSTFDEAPDLNLYLLPEAYGWDFVRWGPRPRRESPDEYLSIVLSREVVSETPERGWFKQEVYEAKVNPWKATLTKVPTDQQNPSPKGSSSTPR